jgi:hypothetical protein
LAVLAAGLAVWLVAPGATLATPAWLAPTDLSTTGQDAFEPVVAVDAAGNATAVWERFNGTNDIVQAATRPAGGGWSAGQDLSAAGENARRQHVGVDAAGNATAVWERSNGTNFIIQAATRPAGDAWGAAQDLSAAGQEAQQPDVAVGAAGDAVAVWKRSNGTNFIIQAATRLAGGGWGAAQDLSAVGQEAQDPRIAVDGHGNAVAVWSRSNGTNFIIQAATRPAGGGWGAAQDLSATGQNAFDAHVAVDPQGNATAVWRRFDGANEIVQAATLPTGGSWSSAQNLSSAGQSASKQHVAVDAQGNATAVWNRFNGTNSIVQAATMPAGGSWSSPQDLSAAGQNANDPFVAVDGQGDTVASWYRFNGTNSIVQAATMPAGGGWGAAQDLSATGQNAFDARVALDAQGNAAAVWRRFDGTHYIVQAAGYQIAGPRLNMLQIPASGVAGTSLLFSVSPFSVWGIVASTSWSWGDGSPTTPGASVTHTYAAPGNYQVTVGSTDAFGNSTIAHGQVVITAAPATPSRAVFGGSTLVSTNLTVDAHGNVTFQVTCSASANGASCSDAAALYTDKGKLPAAVTSVKKRKPTKTRKATLLGKAQFTVPASQALTERIHLNVAGRKLARAHGRFRARLLLTSGDRSGQTVTHQYRVTIKRAETKHRKRR